VTLSLSTPLEKKKKKKKKKEKRETRIGEDDAHDFLLGQGLDPTDRLLAHVVVDQLLAHPPRLPHRLRLLPVLGGSARAPQARLIREATGADRGASAAGDDLRRTREVVGGEDQRGCALRGELGHRVPADAGGYVLQRRGLRGCGAGTRPRLLDLQEWG